MSGFMQGSFFFGYMAIVCFGFFLMLGTVGWRASLMFVRHIYKVQSCACCNAQGLHNTVMLLSQVVDAAWLQTTRRQQHLLQVHRVPGNAMLYTRHSDNFVCAM